MHLWARLVYSRLVQIFCWHSTFSERSDFIFSSEVFPLSTTGQLCQLLNYAFWRKIMYKSEGPPNLSCGMFTCSCFHKSGKFHRWHHGLVSKKSFQSSRGKCLALPEEQILTFWLLHSLSGMLSWGESIFQKSAREITSSQYLSKLSFQALRSLKSFWIAAGRSGCFHSS